MITRMKTDHMSTRSIRMSTERRDCLRREVLAALQEPVPHITDVSCARSAGGIHDFYSEGDYWWPDPEKPDGTPYIRRDGETNPENFVAHRLILRRMRNFMSALAAEAAFFTSPEDEEHLSCLSSRAERICREFFLDEDTRMNPSLTYAQAIHGVCIGRGIGIIDTIHLADVPYAVEMLHAMGRMDEAVYQGVRDWFASYLEWLLTSKNGIEEMNTENNHAVCFFMQTAVFARFADRSDILKLCRDQFKSRLLSQMAEDGSFPRELARTKPYNYSAFTLDNLCILAEAASVPEDDLWTYADPEGRSLEKGIDFLLPYLQDKSAWPYPKDVMHFSAFPVPYAFLFFAGSRLNREDCRMLYDALPAHIEDEEALRNLSVRQPMLWMPPEPQPDLR